MKKLAGLALLLALCLGLGLGACAQAKKTEVSDSPNPKLATTAITIGGAKLIAEVASTSVERERGLMFRAKLEDGEGMLFVFDQDDKLSFWMKNTKLPLSLAYIASDFAIRQIVDLEPESLAPVQSERSVRYALEVPRGWFQRVGVRVGDKLSLGALPD